MALHLAGTLRHFLLGLGKLVIGVTEKDQPQNWDGILGRLQLGVGSEFIRSVPEAFFKVSVICGHI